MLKRLLARPANLPVNGALRPLKRLFVDVSTIARHDAGTGIQRVVRSVCRELATREWGEFEIHAVAATRWRPFSVVSTDLMPSRGVPPSSPLTLSVGDAFLGLDLSAQLLPKHERALAKWKANGATIGLFVYDLLPFFHPEWFGPRTGPHFRNWLETVTRVATLILPISITVEQDLQRYFATHPLSRRPPRMTVIPLSGDIGKFENRAQPDGDPVIAAMRERRAILMVGTVEPRKGHEFALRAHRELWVASDNAPLLVMAGKSGWKTGELQAELRKLTIERDGAIWLDDVCDDRLDRLYRACAGVIVPSLGEGYCLPLHEALAYGKPVLARDLPVLREIEGPGIKYFGADGPRELAPLLADLASSSQLGKEGSAIVGWDETVRAIMMAFEESNRVASERGKDD